MSGSTHRSRSSDNDVTRFVLLSTQRSGTSWVMERLAAHPRIGAYGEMLLRTHRDPTGPPDWPPGAEDRPTYVGYLRDRRADDSRIAEHRSLFEYLDYLYEPRRGFRAIGFKLMYDEARPYPELLAYFKGRRVRILHLVRTNLIDLLMSREAIERRSNSHAWSPEQREQVRVYLDTRRLVGRLRLLERERRVASLIVRGLGIPVHDLRYEDLLVDDGALDGALAFLGFDAGGSAELRATMLKLAPMSHREGMANYPEVAYCLAGTRFSRFLRP